MNGTFNSCISKSFFEMYLKNKLTLNEWLYYLPDLSMTTLFVKINNFFLPYTFYYFIQYYFVIKLYSFQLPVLLLNF